MKTYKIVTPLKGVRGNTYDVVIGTARTTPEGEIVLAFDMAPPVGATTRLKPTEAK